MQGIYTYIPEKNYVPREYSVAAILLLLFIVLISLVSVLNLLQFYINTLLLLLLLLLYHTKAERVATIMELTNPYTFHSSHSIVSNI